MSELRRMRPLLGTYVEIGVQEDTPCARMAITHAFAAIEDLQRRLSFQDPNSELSRLNRSPGSWVSMHPISVQAIRLAAGMTRASAGLFNCTVGGALVRQGVLPNPGLAQFLEAGYHRDIEIDETRVRLLRPVYLTLDGIAKGYAVDLAVRRLQQAGQSSGWVNAGGDLRVFGDQVLPIVRREGDGTMHSLGHLKNQALATSQVSAADDERFPGRIVRPDQNSPSVGIWTILANRTWLADALTKVACLTQPSRQQTLVRQFGGRLIGNTL